MQDVNKIHISFSWILLFFTISFILTAHSISAYELPVFPTGEKVEVRETSHFKIIYQAPLFESIPFIADYCEEAYSVLTGIFNWIPTEKTTVLIQDGMDTHNGWATPIPHNTFTIYIGGPEPGSELFQKGNYLKRTIYHELTHVITMDIRLGYSRHFSNIFGKIVPSDIFSYGLFLFTTSPVALSPRWFVEGLAIWSETEFCPPGRGRSTEVDMMFRCAVQENSLLSYTQWYSDIPFWPYGRAPYLYGMRMIQYIDETSTLENNIGGLTKNLAESFLFDINPAMEKITGKNLGLLDHEMRYNEIQVQERNLKRLETLPTTKIRRLTPKEICAYHPVFADGKIYFLGMEEEKRSSLYQYDPQTGKTEQIQNALSTGFFGDITVAPNGRVLYYTALNIQNNENFWYEIRRYDIRQKSDILVTSQGRYRTIDFSPDKALCAGISQRAGEYYLILLAIDENGKAGEEEILLKRPLLKAITSPRFSPDGDRIAFVQSGTSGFALNVLDLTLNSVETIYESESQILTPAWHPGRNYLAFSSDINGVYNIYEIEAAGGSKPNALTHVTGGLFSPEFSSDGSTITATGYDAQGPHLVLFPYQTEPFGLTDLPVIRSSWKAEIIPNTPENINGQEMEHMPGAAQSRPYNSFTNIRPDYWSPWLAATGFGWQGGISAAFSDPAGYQNLWFAAGAASRYNTRLGTIQHQYRGIYPWIRTYVLTNQELYPGLLVEQGTEKRFDHGEEVLKYGIALKYPFIKREWQASFQLGYEYKARKFINEITKSYQGSKNLAIDPFGENESSLWARISYFNGTAFRRSCSVEDGRLVTMVGDISRKEWGGELARRRITGEWREYLPMPWYKNHALLLSGFYGFGTGDNVAQGHFGLGGMGSLITADEAGGIERDQDIRGYPVNYQTGERVMKAGLSYRFPLIESAEGSEGEVPIYLRQMCGELFFERGRTWDDSGYGDNYEWISSMGLEVNIAMTLLRLLKAAPGIGIVYAPDLIEDTDDSSKANIYFSIKGWVEF